MGHPPLPMATGFQFSVSFSAQTRSECLAHNRNNLADRIKTGLRHSHMLGLSTWYLLAARETGTTVSVAGGFLFHDTGGDCHCDR
jgi:hypothetical protein